MVRQSSPRRLGWGHPSRLLRRLPPPRNDTDGDVIFVCSFPSTSLELLSFSSLRVPMKSGRGNLAGKRCSPLPDCGVYLFGKPCGERANPSGQALSRGERVVPSFDKLRMSGTSFVSLRSDLLAMTMERQFRVMVRQAYHEWRTKVGTTHELSLHASSCLIR